MRQRIGDIGDSVAGIVGQADRSTGRVGNGRDKVAGVVGEGDLVGISVGDGIAVSGGCVVIPGLIRFRQRECTVAVLDQGVVDADWSGVGAIYILSKLVLQIVAPVRGLIRAACSSRGKKEQIERVRPFLAEFGVMVGLAIVSEGEGDVHTAANCPSNQGNFSRFVPITGIGPADACFPRKRRAGGQTYGGGVAGASSAARAGDALHLQQTEGANTVALLHDRMRQSLNRDGENATPRKEPYDADCQSSPTFRVRTVWSHR